MIAVDSTSSGSNALTTSLTVAHTCSGNNRLLVVALYDSNSIADPTSVTYAGVSMTLLTETDVGGPNVRILYYYLLNPASGTNNIIVSFAVANQVGIANASYTGVRQSAPEANQSSGAVASPFSRSVTTVANRAWVIQVAVNSDSVFTVSAPATKRIETAVSNTVAIFDSNTFIPTATTYTVTASWTGGRNGATIVASWAPAPEGAGIIAALL